MTVYYSANVFTGKVTSYDEIITEGALDLVAPSGEDLVIKMGDAIAGNKVSFVDSAGVEVAWIDSDGGASFAGGGADFFADDIPIKFGNVTGTPDASIEWDTASAPNCLLTTSPFNVLSGDYKQIQGATDMMYLDARSTPHTFTAGILDIDLTTATTNNKGIDVDVVTTATTGIQTYGQLITVVDHAVVTATDQYIYGHSIGITKDGADTSTDHCYVTGQHVQITNSGATDAGSKTTKGLDLYVTGDSAGTSIAYGAYSYVQSADTNYGYYTSSQGGSLNYGLYAVAASQVTQTSYGIYATSAGGGTNYAAYLEGPVAGITTLDIDSMASNWTNAGRTIADLGTVSAGAIADVALSAGAQSVIAAGPCDVDANLSVAAQAAISASHAQNTDTGTTAATFALDGDLTLANSAARSITVPTQGIADANGVGLTIAADAAGSGGAGVHNGGIVQIYGGAKAGAGTDGYVKIGHSAGTPTHLSSDDDLYVNGRLEVDGLCYLDSNVTIGNDLTCGNGIYAYLSSYIGAYADDGMHIAPYVNSNLIYGHYDWRSKDYDHSGASTNPTVFIHSAVDPDLSNNQWVSITHDQEGAVISTGVNVGTGSAPTTDDNYIMFSPRGAEQMRLHGTGRLSIKALSVDVEAVTASVDTSRDSYYFGCDTAGADTITIKSLDCVDGRILVIKDEGGNASAQNIVIATEGAETIDGAASLTLSVDYDAVTLIARNSNWWII